MLCQIGSSATAEALPGVLDGIAEMNLTPCVSQNWEPHPEVRRVSAQYYVHWGDLCECIAGTSVRGPSVEGSAAMPESLLCRAVPRRGAPRRSPSV